MDVIKNKFKVYWKTKKIVRALHVESVVHKSNILKKVISSINKGKEIKKLPHRINQISSTIYLGNRNNNEL